MNVELIMDGSVTQNPGGFGKWCCIVKGNEQEIVLTGTEEKSTNNRMEALGLVTVLPELFQRGCFNFKVTTDSMYVIYCLKGWRKRKKKVAKLPNADIWQPIYALLNVYSPVITYNWVKGHNGYTDNERVDKLCSSVEHLNNARHL